MSKGKEKQNSHGRKKIFIFFVQIFQSFFKDNCLNLSAAIAFYLTFSLPPLLILIILITGIFVSPDEVQGQIYQHMQSLLGEQGASQIQAIIINAHGPGAGNTFTVAISIIAVIFSATGSFLSLQNALNSAWNVMRDPQKKGGSIKYFFMKRLLSLILILFIIVLLLISMAISGLLTALSDVLSRVLPPILAGWVLYLFNMIITLIVTIIVFAAMFKILPDVRLTWHNVWAGAIFTAVLFVIAKEIFVRYIARNNPGSVFGAAGSLAVLLLWIFFTAFILLLGAEFTQAWVHWQKKTIAPLPGIVHFNKTAVRDTNQSHS